jgi:hypothetical protein
MQGPGIRDQAESKRQFRCRGFFRDAPVPPTVSDCAAIAGEVFIKQNNDVQAGEAVGYATEPEGRLLHGELDVQEDKTRTGLPHETQSIGDSAGFSNDSRVDFLFKDAPQRLPEVRAAVGYYCSNQRIRGVRLHFHLPLKSHDDRAERPCLWGIRGL